jgi:hypothetical protein
MSDPRAFVVCPPAQCDEPPPFRGGRFASCSLCHCAVVVMPSSEGMIAEGTPLACMPCVVKMAVMSDEPFVPELPTEAQLAEVSRERGREVTRAEVEGQLHDFADFVRMLQAVRRGTVDPEKVRELIRRGMESRK